MMQQRDAKLADGNKVNEQPPTQLVVNKKEEATKEADVVLDEGEQIYEADQDEYDYAISTEDDSGNEASNRANKQQRKE